MRRRTWKVGELAERMGTSVRTLHYYEEMGLLSPSRTTKGGHRLYTTDEAARVQQIKWLQHLGLGLRKIEECLDDPTFSRRRLLRLYGAWLREQIELGEKLRNRLEAIEGQLRSGREVSTEELTGAMKAMSMFEKPLTAEQREVLKTGGQAIEPERDRQ